ncbi:MAG: outer membrane beta-barrel protein [Bacteroidota bacterium]
MTQRFLPLYILFILCFSNTYAQRGPGGNGDGSSRMPAIGRVYGKVIETGSKQPVEYATITLMNGPKDSVITGALAKANGDFSLDKIPFGRFKLRIQFIGYKTLYQPIVITPNNLEQDIGNIKIEPDTRALNEVTITAEKQTVNMAIDKRVYNPDKDLSAKGGTALDVMKNVPGVTVDADGNVALRNSSPTIFIDGRPSNLTLEQIPADQIDRIEVVTNPSAKYDASATGGILNVFLKKNAKPGYNGMINAGIGTNNRYNLMTNLNIKEGRTNFFISYNLNSSQNPTKGYTRRSNLSNGVTTGYFNQNTSSLAERTMQNGRIGFDFDITNRSTITLSQSIMAMDMNNRDDQTYTQTDGARNLLFEGGRINDQTTEMRNYTSQIQFRKVYPRKGKEFTTDLSYNHAERNTNATFTTDNKDNNGTLVSQDIQLNNGSGTTNMFNFQFDFILPLTDSSKMEFGAKSNYKVDKTLLNVSNLNHTSGAYDNDSNLSNNYDIKNLINAVYVNYSGMFRSIGYQAGVRFEQTHFTGDLLGKNLTYEYYYPDGTKNLGKAFFPSLYLSKKLSGNQEFQLNFSRKINRPDFMQIMPFIMFSDKQNYRIGNPNLSPEFFNIAEANYNKIFKNGSVLSSVYVRQTERAITNYVYKLPSDSSILVTTFINGNNSLAYGWENNLKYSLFNKKLDLTFNGTIFYTTISASANNVQLQNSGISWNAKGIAAYKFPKQYTMQINGGYEAPKIIPQGTTRDVYSVDLSLNKEIIKNLSLSLTLNDVFNTRRFGTYYESDSFTQDLSRRRETRFLRLTVSWRFGEMDASLFRKRKANRDNQNGGMEGDF